MIDLKKLCLVGGKVAWMAYPDIYCLDADGSCLMLHYYLQLLPFRIDNAQLELEKQPVNTEKRKLKLNSPLFSLMCLLYKNYILAGPTAEEESIMETVVTVVLDLSYQLVSLNKPGEPVLAHTSVIQDCVALARQRVKELQSVLNGAISDMEVD
ncbi:unnamed protein product [Withania somnifera]